MHLSISAYATALFSSWYFIDEYSLLFDAGDGVTAGLTQKARKVKHVFISHADRDHLTGLLQFVQLNAREGFPNIYFPKDSYSFPALAAFSERFDPHVAAIRWQGVAPGEEIIVGTDLVVVPLRNEHIRTEAHIVKSLGYILQHVKHKLRPEYAGLPGKEIAALRKEKGDATVMMKVHSELLGYSGDTPVDHDGRWDNVETLIHEATFLTHAHNEDHEARYNKHSVLPDVIAMAAKTNIKRLVLGHFSLRYTHEEIIAAIQEQCRLHQVKFPVYCILPGIVNRDVLGRPPVWSADMLSS